MMPASPKVSVLIPTYNYGSFLDETIQCVLDQTFTDYELIIIDNHSTDNTRELVQKYLGDQRVKYVRNEKNIGLVGNWNKALELATGTYIKFLCADDKLHPEVLEKFTAVMDAHPSVVLVTSWCQLFGSKNLTIKKPFTGKVAGVEVIKDTLARSRNWLGEPTAVMFRRADLRLGLLHKDLYSHIDLEFFLRILSEGDCYIIPEVLYYIRKHSETETAQLLGKRFQNVFENYKFAWILKWDSRIRKDQIEKDIDRYLHRQAIGCAKVMYKVLPGLHKSENRRLFRKAFQVGWKEGVLLAPLTQLIKGQNKQVMQPLQPAGGSLAPASVGVGQEVKS